MPSFLDKYKLLFSISFLSAAIIAFQLALMQILSIVQWHHFAFMVISVALLGFGAAGSILSIFRENLVRHFDTILPLLMAGTGIAMALVIDISQVFFIRFDSYLLFSDYSQAGNLLLTYLLFFVPFLLGALAIGLIFVKYIDAIGKLYFANLLGSGAGAVLALFVIWQFFPNQLPAFISILPVIAGFIIISRKHRGFQFFFMGIAVLVIMWKWLRPPELVLSQYKDISKILLLPEATITLEKTSPYGLFQTATSPVLRYAPGLSITAQQTALVKAAVFINGDWFGAITNWNKKDSSFVLDYTTMALPYMMKNRTRVLVLRAGTGIDVAHALSRDAQMVVATEPNSIISAALRTELADETDSLFYDRHVSIHNLEPRTFLMTDTSGYDLISLPMVGTFGGSSGLFALQEQFILTKEAFVEMWRKLNQGGVVSVTSWMDYPVRNPFKIIATLLEVLEDLGIEHPERHIAAIRSWGTISFVLTKSPLTENEIQNIRKFCEEMGFDPAILPGLDHGERTRYNQFQDNRFFESVDKLFSSQRNEFYQTYDFNIQPATDNKPYFSQFIKWKNLPRLATYFGNRSLPFFEIGYLIVIITLIQISLFSIIFILLPLFHTGWKSKHKLSMFCYFGGIGLGYMFVEMVFIQRFILYFGNPVYSASAIITSLLIFSGMGSYASDVFIKKRNRLWLVFAWIVSILLIYSGILTPILQQTIHLTWGLKLLTVFLLVAPLAFLMGIPFPSGLAWVSASQPGQIPWAWGINGCVSVISTALATIVAVEAGFTFVMVMAAFGYALALVVALKWRSF